MNKIRVREFKPEYLSEAAGLVREAALRQSEANGMVKNLSSDFCKAADIRYS